MLLTTRVLSMGLLWILLLASCQDGAGPTIDASRPVEASPTVVRTVDTVPRTGPDQALGRANRPSPALKTDTVSPVREPSTPVANRATTAPQSRLSSHAIQEQIKWKYFSGGAGLQDQCPNHHAGNDEWLMVGLRGIDSSSFQKGVSYIGGFSTICIHFQQQLQHADQVSLDIRGPDGHTKHFLYIYDVNKTDDSSYLISDDGSDTFEVKPLSFSNKPGLMLLYRYTTDDSIGIYTFSLAINTQQVDTATVRVARCDCPAITILNQTDTVKPLLNEFLGMGDLPNRFRSGEIMTLHYTGFQPHEEVTLELFNMSSAINISDYRDWYNSTWQAPLQYRWTVRMNEHGEFRESLLLDEHVSIGRYRLINHSRFEKLEHTFCIKMGIRVLQDRQCRAAMSELVILSHEPTVITDPPSIYYTGDGLRYVVDPSDGHQSLFGLIPIEEDIIGAEQTHLWINAVEGEWGIKQEIWQTDLHHGDDESYIVFTNDPHSAFWSNYHTPMHLQHLTLSTDQTYLYLNAIETEGRGYNSPGIFLAINLATSQITELGSMGFALGGGWVAPDGERVIFHDVRVNDVSYTAMYGQLSQLDQASHLDHQDTVVEDVVWLPDGHFIYTTGTEVRLANHAGQTTRVLATADRLYEIALSPDTTRIAYVTGDGQTEAQILWIKNIEFGTSRKVATLPADARALTWR